MPDIVYPHIFFASRFNKTKPYTSYETPLEVLRQDERTVSEMADKGWVDIQIEVAPGVRYELHLYDPVRLRQTAESTIKEGEPCFAEPGLVILIEVTPTTIETAVQFLWEHAQLSFFSGLKPVEDYQAHNVDEGSS